MKQRIQYLIFVFILFSLNTTQAQQNFKIIGNIINAETEDTLIGVNVYPLDFPHLGTSTNHNGDFQLTIPNTPMAIRFSYIGFYEQTILITDTTQTSFKISLRPAISSLPEIIISSAIAIDTLFKEPYSIMDYEIYDNQILLLAWKNSIAKYALLVLDEEANLIIDYALKNFKPVSLFKDCLDKIYLINKLFTYEINLDSLSVQFDNKISTISFEENTKPCVSASDNFKYFSQYYFQGQALQYHAIPKSEKDTPKRLPMIQHENNIALLMEETGTRYPRSGDVWQKNVAENLVVLRELDYQLMGMMKIFYPKINAPLITTDSFVYIFNHADDVLQVIKESGETLFDVPISYHRTKKWRKELLFDERRGQVYTIFNTKKGEAIRKIHLEDGTLGPAIPLDRPFVKKRKVYNGYLYFLYKNSYVGDRNLKLHRMRL